MCELAIKIPDAVLYDTRMTKEQALCFAKRAIALSYYTQNGVSIGYCAQIAGMTEEDFIKCHRNRCIVPSCTTERLK